MTSRPSPSPKPTEKELFLRAIAIEDDGKRKAFIKEACGEDEKLRARIERLRRVYESEDHGLLDPSRYQSLETERDSLARELQEETDFLGYLNSGTQCLGDFELLEEIGRGAMGVVFRARQRSLDREVAVKIILGSSLASPAERERFHLEAESAARLDHPNIVPIYEVGRQDNHDYYSMALVRGGTLGDRMAKEKLEHKKAVRLIAKVAHALQTAHQRGIIHRDLKPDNILLDEEGEPHISDFGLACRLEQESTLTLSGQIMGTPQYMAPEQADSSLGATTTAADTYGLGSILYELLAGVPAFRGKSVLETLRMVKEMPPQAPRAHDPAIDRDLDTIVLKCLEKDPDRRYGSARAFAEDLEAWLEHRPIAARPPTTAERVVRTLRRHYIATLVAAAFIVLVLTSAVVSWSLYLKARDARIDINENLKVSERNRYTAEMYQASREVGRAVGFTRVDELMSDWLPGADSVDLRGWEWYYLQSLIELQGELAREPWPQDMVWSVHWNPEGTLLASAGFDKKVRLWRMDSDESIAELDHANPVWTVRWSPDGTRLATGAENGELSLWEGDVERGFNKRPLRGHDVTEKISVVSWSPDGAQLASACDDHTIGIWNTLQATKSGPFIEHRLAAGPADRAWDVDWSPDGLRLASTSNLGVVKLWDPKTRTLTGRFKAHNAGSSSGQWHPDSRRLLTAGGDGTLKVWDVENQKDLFEEELHVFDHAEEVLRSYWSRDGTRLASTSRDGIVYAWNFDTKRIEQYFKGHEDSSLCADWHPGGKLLASGGHDGIRVWNCSESLDSPRRTIDLTEPGAGGRIGVYSVAWDPKGEKLLSALSAPIRNVACWDIATGARSFRNIPIDANALAWSPDGAWFGVTTVAGDLAVFDRAGGLVKQFGAEAGPHGSLAWNPEGTQLAVGGRSGIVQIWDTGSWKRVRRMSAAPESRDRDETRGIQGVDWSPDGNRLLTAVGGAVRIWDALTGQEIRTVGSLPRAACVKWSPDGTRFVASDADGEAMIWDARTGASIHQLPGHKDRFHSARWSPDGSRILTGSRDGTLKMWDTHSGRPVFTLMEGRHGSCDWSPDGTMVAAGTNYSRIEIWDASVAYDRERQNVHESEE